MFNILQLYYALFKYSYWCRTVVHISIVDLVLLNSRHLVGMTTSEFPKF